MRSVVFIDAVNSGYSVEQVETTMTVADLVELLSCYEPESSVFLRFDNGYTYGGIAPYLVEEGLIDEED